MSPRTIAPLRIALAALLLALATQVCAAAQARPMAVLFSAPWCYNCKLIKPKLKTVEAEFGAQIDFIVLDFADDASRSAAESVARERGFLPLFAANRATGWVALLDRDGHQVGELKQDMTVEEMQARLQTLLH